ncbi:MAG: 23S rRNA (guanosine(2251)-2'-O)-methyltransferase RlmB [Flavobacteriales bacterium]|nr:23S rRNA (guanosine(2251)-2'-O)-methyltransferase RlmB [Flavobacteriales bacterium]MCB9191447.1 23S rRNA (guanosine(2251)-2'-O)-methyltransferase RlmB [Flavobacteriales bacterium]MCB9203927.1 23S rRNA (guanosine(2251)-2'-O)-methyltransferase RlmB [Flavobacteriales bacterium]
MRQSDTDNNLVFGVHPVQEAIDSGKEIEKVFLKKGSTNNQLIQLKGKMRKLRIPFQEVPPEKLNRFTRKNHQGVVALLSPIEYQEISEVVPRLFEEGKVPLILVLDRVSDVGNFGAICRSAECAGVNAILIPSKGSAQVNSFAVKSSAGAIFNVPICRTNHFLSEVRDLAESGLKVVAVSEKGEKSIYQADLSGPMALVMGSEEDGIGDGLMELAQEHVSIPMFGNTGSLNVSVATGITLFERLRQTLK